MKNYLRKIFITASLFIIVFFIIFAVNQTVQVINIATNLNPIFGQIALYTLLVVYVILVLTLIIIFFRLPQALKPPENNHSTELTIYLEKLAKRLRRNKYLKNEPLNTRREIEKALQILDKEADLAIKRSATAVFVTTAISQSGRLDTFMVLIAQFRMVWQVATLYYQRPTLGEILNLYANVFATAFVAGELNDLDVSQQVEPIITSVLGVSLTSTIPGVNIVASIVTNSLLTGAANAYLTLRIGVISKKYCSSLVRQERQYLRRSASVEAARMLAIIVMNSAGNITKSIINAALKSPGKVSRDVLRSTWGKLVGKGKVAPEVSGE